MERQLDLFSEHGRSAEPPLPVVRRPLDAARLDDAALIAAIPQASLAAADELAAEAGRRQLAAAVPALRALCRRLAGAGLDRPVPEQVAALQALATIGGSEARAAVAWLIAQAVIIGPTLGVALDAAARLGAAIPAEKVAAFLRHDDRSIKTNACRCARPGPAVIPLLLDLLAEADRQVRTAAACALGRMGRAEARSTLVERLEAAPSTEVIDAVTGVADERCVVALVRIVERLPALAESAVEALDAIDHPRARAALARLRPPVD